MLLLGLGTTSLAALESLSERFDVVGIVRRPEPADDPCVVRASALGVPVVPDVSVAAVERLVATTRPDCVVVSSYDRILAEPLLARVPFVNVHYSALPQYRGRANVNWAIINGEVETAISIHVMAPGLDEGNILFQQATQIEPRASVGDLYDRLNGIQRRQLGPAVERFLDGYTGKEQDETQASWGCTRLPGDGAIDWTETTEAIDRLVRGVSEPFPGAFTHLDGRRVWVWRAEPVEQPRRYAGRVPGRVVGRSLDEGWVDVLTGDGVLRLMEIQLEDQERSDAASVIRSVKVSLGISLPGLLERIHALEGRVAELEAGQAHTTADAGPPDVAGGPNVSGGANRGQA